MAKLFGKEYGKKELLTRMGDISQVGGVRLQTLGDGKEAGVRTVRFRTGSGLDFTVLADRGLDISTAEFNGQSLAWRSPTSDVSPAFYEEPENRWLRNFTGGLVVTCGYTYAGASCEDRGTKLGLHGRASNLPASNLCCDAEWDGDSYVMWAQGKMRESVVFGENVELCRRISAKLGEPKIYIHDKVTNMGWERIEHMFLYHCNLGFPVLDEGSRLIAANDSATPRDEEAETEKELYAEFTGPVHWFKERCYYLGMLEDSEGYVSVGLVNPSFRGGQGIGVYLRYLKSELPKFTEWKCTDEGTYVCGFEPANCWVEGRAKERERGTLQFLEAGETREYHLEIGVLTSSDEIRAFEEKLNQTRRLHT
jgi:hypothetical protein